MGNLLRNYGLRLDGTPKERGYLGEIPVPNSRDVMTELSIGQPNNPNDPLRPSIVPGALPVDINYLQQTGQIPQDMVATANWHARKRIAQGLSPFWNAAQDLRSR